MVFTETKFQKRIHELEAMDKSVNVKHLPRSKWPKELINNKILLWQVPKDTAKLLYTLVRLHRPKRILELGTSGGYSTLWMSRAASEYGGTIDTIEFSEYRFSIAKTSFEEVGCENIIQHQGKTADILSEWSKPVDMVFIDHSKENYLDDYRRVESHLSDRAIVVADNMLDNPRKVMDFREHMEESNEFEAYVINVDNGVLIATRK
ncbi:MAG: O-methyltransferase [Candidatus Woesearchaeota archaeon]